MTDPFSVVTGLAGVLAVAGTVIAQCYRYGCGVSGAPEEAQRLVSEVTSLSGILLGLQGMLKQHDLSSGDQVASVLHDCKVLLETLSLKLQKHSPDSTTKTKQAITKRLLWPLRKKDTEELTVALERHKSALSLALDAFSMWVTLRRLFLILT